MNGPTRATDRLVDLLWDQEIFHQRVLHELLAETDLARRLELWDGGDRPIIINEPFRGLFDLALTRDRTASPAVLIELKAWSELGQNQLDRQAAGAIDARRAYILLGRTYYQWRRQTDLRTIGLPELAVAVRETAAEESGATGELASAYARELAEQATVWANPLTPDGRWTGLEFYRFYDEIREAWPPGARIYHATNPSGPDWILNAWDWAHVASSVWSDALFYWEIVGGRCRFKIEWKGPRESASRARDAYREALLAAGRDLGEAMKPTRSRVGTFMGAADLGDDMRDDLLVDGAVDPVRAAALYARATQVFTAALQKLETIEP
jgi:hypothetical protein